LSTPKTQPRRREAFLSEAVAVSHQENAPRQEKLGPTALEMAAKGGKKPGDGQGAGTAVITRTKTQTQRPSMYRVLLLNDDYTPMDFVIGVLCSYFHKDFDDANRIMWQVHNNGVGECGVYTYEVADTKVTQVMDHAKKHQHPLQCVMEKK
jgi:ATP-dependent Clp protease adaptor protein ClpS